MTKADRLHSPRLRAAFVALAALALAGPLAPSASAQLKIVDDPDVAVTDNSDPDKVFNVVEQMPVFPGGQSALAAYLAERIVYPENAMRNGVQGRVVVQFVIKKDGTVGEAKVVRGKDPELDAEALRVVGTLPAFEPGKMAGNPVNVWFTLPVTFRIPEQKPADDRVVITGCGTPEFYSAMAATLVYPPKAAKKELMGTVYVTFDVDADGTFKVIHTKPFPDPRRSGAPGVQKKDIQMLTDAAVQAITEAVAKVGPAKANGEAFPSRFLLPVRFQIQDKPYFQADYTPMAPMTILDEIKVVAPGK